MYEAAYASQAPELSNNNKFILAKTVKRSKTRNWAYSY